MTMGETLIALTTAIKEADAVKLISLDINPLCYLVVDDLADDLDFAARMCELGVLGHIVTTERHGAVIHYVRTDYYVTNLGRQIIKQLKSIYEQRKQGR